MSASEELQGQGGVGDDGAALLLDRPVDCAGFLDVAGLALRDSEQFGDALDAVHQTGAGVLRDLASDGVGDRSVDDVAELGDCQVDESCVWIDHVVIVLVCWPPGAVSNRLVVGRSVADGARRGSLLQSPGKVRDLRPSVL